MPRVRTRAGVAAVGARHRIAGIWIAALSTAVAAAALVVTPVAADAVADTSPPALTAFSVSPHAVDDSAGQSSVTAHLQIADATGFNRGTITFAAGSAALDAVWLDAGDLTSGTLTNGGYDVAIPIPQETPGGAYTATVSLTDAGNHTGSTTPSAVLTITHQDDTTPPVLVGGVDAAPTSVDTTRHARTVVYSVHLSDDISGVADATLTLQNPHGDLTELALNPPAGADGTPADGDWTGDAVIDPQDPAGSWTVVSLDAHDGYGNLLDRSAGLGGAVAVSHTADTAAPELLTVTPMLSTTAIDTTSESPTVTVAVRAIDDLSGVVGGNLEFSSPDGTQTADGGFSGDPAAGTATDGYWTAHVVFPVRGAAGTWTLTYADVSDAQGNQSFYDATDGPAPPTARVRATLREDSAAPTLTSLRLGPSTVSTAYDGGDAYVVGQVGFTDDISGVAQAVVSFQDPTGVVDHANDITIDATDTPVVGSPLDGTMGFSAVLPSAAAGVWSIASVTLIDQAGNQQVVTAADSLGTHAAVTVVAANSDAAPPAPTSLTIAPTSVDPTQDVSVSLGVSDGGAPAAGFDYGALTLVSPSGVQVEYDFQDPPVAGDDVAGVYTETHPLGDAADIGEWHVGSLTLTDRAGNRAAYDASSLAIALGGPAPGLTVTRAPDPAPFEPPHLTAPSAPPVISVSAADGRATVRWDEPDYDGGADVTGYTVVGTPNGRCATTGTSCVVSGLTNGVVYTFTVVAANAEGLGAPAATPAVVPRATTRLGAPAAPGSVGFGEAARVTGRLTTAAGRGIAGQRVRLEYRRAGSAGGFSILSTATSSATGSLAFAVRPRYSGQLRLAVPANGGYAAAVSTAVSTAVRRAVSIAASSRAVRHGRSVRLHGMVSPSAAGQTVSLQRRVGSTWRTVARKRLAGGAYSLSATLATKGAYRFRVTIGAAGGLAGGASATCAVRAR
ncbi:fibronectin type III domain-containing protein [uncultured Jatrophihabitans sp.]|uniref:fibronectin type III domain-containing protein n=1 Tax=uncultured Jatrophihabitans sp. TaxID=1610747 RepID=UPI0035CAC7B1